MYFIDLRGKVNIKKDGQRFTCELSVKKAKN